MRLRWDCFLFVGPASVGDEPGECGHSFESDADEDDVADKSASAHCPKCGGELTMEYDHPTVLAVGH